MPTISDRSQGLKEFMKGWDSSSDEYLGDAPFPKFFVTDFAASWDEFLAWQSTFEGIWGFRGQRDAEWFLNTSLDLAVRRHYKFITPNGFHVSGCDHLDREAEGRGLLFRFRQRAHEYIPTPPPVDDLSSWFALMQHHGAPTRFLDWTQSAYVALYFAIEEEAPEQGCAVWAINIDWLEAKARELLPEASGLAADDYSQNASCVNTLLSQTEKPVILKVNPSQISDRMAAQQGFFLCKLYHEPTFSQILMSMMIHPKREEEWTIPEQPVLRRLVLKNELRIGLLKQLRSMNIHRASLFPGLDGFGKSLRLELELRTKAQSISDASGLAIEEWK